MPNEIDGLSKLEANIEQVLEPQPLFNYQKLDLKVPKFEIGNEIQMKEVLEEVSYIFANNFRKVNSYYENERKNNLESYNFIQGARSRWPLFSTLPFVV